jgi:hypothetical protein
MNIILVASRSSCGSFETLSYVFTTQKVFFEICGVVIGALFLLIGKFENKKYTFFSIIISGSFYFFFTVLGILNYLLSTETFYLVFTTSSSKPYNTQLLVWSSI